MIIDESHHFRNRLTKRYQNVAVWLVGQPALLVTATPIVNRLSDLAHQLLLAIRDNALTVDGIPSLRDLLESGPAHPALGHIVVENDGAAELRPRKTLHEGVQVPGEGRTARESLALVGRLRLSRSDTVASLIRGVLLRAASSSPGAFVGFLERYRTSTSACPRRTACRADNGPHTVAQLHGGAGRSTGVVGTVPSRVRLERAGPE